MKRAVVFIFIACCAVSALSLAENEKRSKPSATVSPAGEFETSSSHPAPTTKSTTESTKTTAKTTPKPTTTPTPKPTTKPTPKPTTTPPKPQPTPAVNVTMGTYNLTQDKKVCLLAQMGVEIRLATPKANGSFIIQPKDTKAEGFCLATRANLTLVFKEGYITFMFNKSTAEKTAYVDDLSFKLAYPLSKDGTVYSAQNKSVHLFAAKIGRSYSCKTESLYMGNGLYLDFTKDRVQGFNVTANEFGATDACPADQPDYRVAIAVGVTLLVLIVIVVIAYLLGRKKRADGYQSL